MADEEHVVDEQAPAADQEMDDKARFLFVSFV